MPAGGEAGGSGPSSGAGRGSGAEQYEVRNSATARFIASAAAPIRRLRFTSTTTAAIGASTARAAARRIGTAVARALR